MGYDGEGKEVIILPLNNFGIPSKRGKLCVLNGLVFFVRELF